MLKVLVMALLLTSSVCASTSSFNESGVDSESKVVFDESQALMPPLGSLAASGNMGILTGQTPIRPKDHNLKSTQTLWRDASPHAGAKSVTYSQTEVIQLRLREFMNTTVVLPSWEQIEDILIGDSNTFEARKVGKHILLLKPTEFIGADSNITVVGKSGLVYTFYVQSEGYNSLKAPDLRVHVHVPGEVPKSFSELDIHPNTFKESDASPKPSRRKKEYPGNLAPRMDKLNFLWNMSGDASLAPNQVFSDGIRTWFNYGDRLNQEDMPIISLVIDGVDTPINTRLEGSMIIVNSVGAFSLRNGKRVVCVWPSELKRGA